MSDARLQELVALTDAVFAAENAKLHSITAEETRLREALRTLDARQDAARDAQRDEVSGPRSYGGDVLWQVWVGRSRRELQIRLAQVLARKGRMMDDLRRAHGRKLASERLLKEAQADLGRKEDRQAVARAQGLMVLRATIGKRT